VDKKVEIVGIRLTSEEKENVRKKCVELGFKTLSDCIRFYIRELLEN